MGAFRKQHLRWAMYPLCGILLFAAYFLLVHGITTGIHLWFLWQLPLEQRQWFHELSEKRLTIPGDAFDVKPYSSELLNALARYQSELNAHYSTFEEFQLRFDLRKIVFETKSESEWPKKEDFEKLEPLFDAYLDLVRCDDYTMDSRLVANGRFIGFSFSAGFRDFRGLTRLLTLRSICLEREGDLSSSLQLRLQLLRSMRADKYPDAIHCVLQIPGHDIVQTKWDIWVDHCNDKLLLRQMLDELNALSESLVIEVDPVVMQLNSRIAIGRGIKRAGFEVNLTSGTLINISGELAGIHKEYLRNAVKPSSLTTIEQRNQYDVEMSLCDSRMALNSKPSLLHPIESWKTAFTQGLVLAMDYSSAAHDRTDTLVKRILVRYDLLRLRVARKLYFIEKGIAPGTLNDLVPDYLSSIPPDPFGDKSSDYRFDLEDYSVGPDHVDQHRKIYYDPINGYDSKGDIFLSTN